MKWCLIIEQISGCCKYLLSFASIHISNTYENQCKRKPCPIRSIGVPKRNKSYFNRVGTLNGTLPYLVITCAVHDKEEKDRKNGKENLHFLNFCIQIRASIFHHRTIQPMLNWNVVLITTSSAN